MKDLEIKLKIDRTQARAAADAHVADAKRMEAAVGQAVANQGQMQAGLARDNKGRFQATGQAAEESFKKVGDAGAGAFAKIGLSTAAFQVGLQKALDLASSMSRALKEAADHYRDMTKGFVDQRDQLGELASVMGKPADNAFAKQNSNYNKETGFKFGEGIGFRTAFQGSGQQYAGRTMSQSEFDQYEVQAGKLAVAKGIDPNVVGDLAGTIAGTRDLRGLGDKASEAALGKVNSGMSILAAGKGDNAVLAKQFGMVLSSSMNEDAMKGVFQDSDEAAVAVSTMAERNAAGAAEQVAAASRGLRDFKGKPAALLKRAGIDASTHFTEGIEKLAPVVEQMAQDQGVKVEDVLRDNFEDIETAKSIGVAINKGVGPNGVFAQRRAVAAANQGGDAALGVIGEADKTERVVQRKADADLEAAKADRGSENSRIAALRVQAEAELHREGGLDTTATMLGDWAASAVTLGTFDTRQARIDEKQRDILARRAKSAGVSIDMPDMYTHRTSEATNAYFNESMDKIGAAGGSPLADKLDETNQLLREQNALLQAQQAKPGQPTSTPPPLPSKPNPAPVRP